MSKTNLNCLTEVLGWSDGSLDGCENKPLSVPLPAVIQAMQAARKDEREKIRMIVEKRIADAAYLYDADTVDFFKTILKQIK